MKEFEEMNLMERLVIKHASERSFLNFTRVWFELIQGDKLLVNWHHRMIAREVDRVVRFGDSSTNLAISLPPGGTKTEFMSIHLPAYTNMLVQTGELDRFRNLNLSFADSLVQRNSRRTKEIISSKEYQEFWPCSFGVSKADEWDIVNEKGRTVGNTVSRAMGGQITGGRGGYFGKKFSGAISLDDPQKPEDLFSEVKRNADKRKMVNTVRSRRGDKSKDHPTPFFLVQQRLHTDDITAFCMAGELGVKFKSLKIPSLITEQFLSELDEQSRAECWESIRDSDCRERAGVKYWSYWPEMEHIDQLLDLWDRSEYTFMSQYMQEPIALGGNIFDASWWQFYESGVFNDGVNPAFFEYRFITADTATKTKTYNDFSVMMEWGVYQGKVYAINMVRGKWEAPELRNVFSKFIDEAFERNDHQWGNLRAAHVEDKASGTGLIQEVGRNSPCSIVAVQRNIDKLTRAMDTAPQIKMGNVVLPSNAPWITEFVSEHSTFAADDSHKHDDIVDNTMDAVDIGLMKGQSSAASFISGRKKR
jgi:predicted phage terminase large subunit-like protein